MKFLFVTLLLLPCRFITLAQDTVINDSIHTTAPVNQKKQHKPLAIDLSLFNHSIAVPFHKMINTPFHPGFQAAIEGRYFETPKSKLFQTLGIGMFYNKYNGTGFFLNTELGYRYTSNYNIFAEAMTGIGYLRTYHPVDIYQLNNSGTYEKAKDKGFSSAIASFAFGLGYNVKSSSLFSFSPFIRYGCMIQTHYSPDLNALTHAVFHAGVRINKKRIQ